jgi:predicted  nucleic acid-binding Zn-ribbon protein
MFKFKQETSSSRLNLGHELTSGATAGIGAYITNLQEANAEYSASADMLGSEITSLHEQIVALHDEITRKERLVTTAREAISRNISRITKAEDFLN